MEFGRLLADFEFDKIRSDIEYFPRHPCELKIFPFENDLFFVLAFFQEPGSGILGSRECGRENHMLSGIINNDRSRFA